MGIESNRITGKITFLLVREAKPVNDFLDVELIVGLDTAPITRFGFKFGERSSGIGGIREIIHHSMMDILRDAFNNNWQVTLDYISDLSSSDRKIIQVQISKETMMM